MMKIPYSLIDKEVRILNGPVSPGRLDPTNIQKIDVNYLEYELYVARERYPKSYLVNHLVKMIEELKQDIIALRSHILYIDCQHEDVL